MSSPIPDRPVPDRPAADQQPGRANERTNGSRARRSDTPIDSSAESPSIRIAVAVAVRRSAPVLSGGDQAAVEVALRAAEAWQAYGVRTTVIGYSVAGADAEPALAEIAALGLDRMVWCLEAEEAELADTGAGVLNQSEVAEALAAAIRRDQHDIVFCGDTGSIIASGAVPSMLAALLGVASIRGLVSVEPQQPGTLHAVARLDRGAREQVVLRSPIVASVESAAATLRRAGLRSLLNARRRPIEVVERAQRSRLVSLLPVNAGSPSRIVAPPHGTALERAMELTGAASQATGGQVVELDPPEAARRIVEQLGVWGYPVGDNSDGDIPGGNNPGGNNPGGDDPGWDDSVGDSEPGSNGDLRGAEDTNAR